MVHRMETDARAIARRYYSASSRCLQADMSALAVNPDSVLLWSPRLVALMKPVRHDAPDTWESDLAYSPQDADGWYVHLLVGDMDWARHLAGTLPPLSRLCFCRGCRNRRPHVWPWHRFLL